MPWRQEREPIAEADSAPEFSMHTDVERKNRGLLPENEPVGHTTVAETDAEQAERDERIDLEIDGSFPASDAPSSTPVQGVGEAMNDRDAEPGWLTKPAPQQ